MSAGSLDTCSLAPGVNIAFTGSRFDTVHKSVTQSRCAWQLSHLRWLKTTVDHQPSSFLILSHRVVIELITFPLSFFRSLVEVAASSCIQVTWIRHCYAPCGFEGCRFSKATFKVKEIQEV